MGTGKDRKWLLVGVTVVVTVGAWMLMKDIQTNPKEAILPSNTSSIAYQTESNVFKRDLSEFTNRPTKIHAMIETHPIEEAVQIADFIAEIKITDKAQELGGPIAATIFKAEVIDTMKGDLSPGDMIQIRQDGTSKIPFNDNPLFQPGEHYVLILKNAIDVDYDFWILGGETGTFQVLDDSTLIKEKSLKAPQVIDRYLFKKLIQSELKG